MPHSLQCFIAWFDDLALSDRGRSTNISFDFRVSWLSRVARVLLLVSSAVAAVSTRGVPDRFAWIVRVMKCIDSVNTNIQRSD